MSFSKRWAVLTVFSVLLVLHGSAAHTDAQNTLAGFVYDDRRSPLAFVDVELMNEISVVLNRTRTNGSGRYEFSGLSDGRFYVRVLPFRHNLQDRTEEVTIQTLSILGSGSSYVQQDFYLQSKSVSGAALSNEVVFAQDVPVVAEMLYKEGLAAFESKDAKGGVAKLVAAIENFPTYFAALQRLGSELMNLGDHTEAVKCFIRAAEVNPKSVASFYNLGVSLNKLGKDYNPAALVALEKASVLAPKSFVIELQIGKIHREQGDFQRAEEHLLKAKKLAENSVPEIHKELAQLYGNDLKDFRKAADELEMYMKASNKSDQKTKEQIENLRRKAKASS